jgi:diguanylate cyclase (GGDEF)-like protein/PAS domain S-box-containing protein
MKNLRYFIVFAVILFMALGYKTYDQYQRIHQTEMLLMHNESKALANFIFAFRHTYQKAFLENHIAINEKMIHLLPVKSTSDISKDFSKSVKGEIIIRTVSDRPRNLENMANAFEMKMIHYFRDNPDKEEYFQHLGEDQFYSYVKPLYIKKSCLACHGKREDAIPSIRENYTRAYDYKLGEIRGLLNIEIKENEFFSILYDDFIKTLILTIILYVLFLIMIYQLLRKIRFNEEQYTHDIEQQLSFKTQELKKQKDMYETLFEKSSDGILILKEMQIVQCNQRAIKMIGAVNKEALLDTNLANISPKYQPDGQSSVSKANKMINYARAYGYHAFEWMHQTVSGDLFWVEVHLVPIVLLEEEMIHVTWRDISEQKEAQLKLLEQKEVLYYQAHHDALTGLYNRVFLNDKLTRTIEESKDSKATIAILFIDLDHFKQINDSLGHTVGDKVLKTIAERLKGTIDIHSIVARFGGDEFIIMVNQYHSLSIVSSLAQNILDVVRQPIHIDGRTLYLSSSIGISLYPQDESVDGNNLLKYADSAMYRAKDEGRNNFKFYQPEMTDHALERVMMKADLQEALKKNEFVVYYQPQVDGRKDKLVGLEALVRWNHPKMGLIPPFKFIPLAIESGIMVKIDQWVMQESMRQVALWYKENKIPGVLAINITLSHLRSHDFMPKLQKCMHKIGFNTKWLELEITEGEIMKKHEEAILKLEELSQKGIAIAVDDFGTEYSSLAYLRRLPIDKLKIDRSFIREIPENKDDMAIAKAIIALAQNLHLNIIAEGVETTEQKAFLLENGCFNIQGYLYGKPMSAKEFEAKFLS